MPFSATNLAEIESHLATHPYLSQGGLPGADDAQIYFDLGSNLFANFRMPNPRYPPQRLLLVAIHQQFLQRLDEEVDRKGPQARSQEASRCRRRRSFR